MDELRCKSRFYEDVNVIQIQEAYGKLLHELKNEKIELSVGDATMFINRQNLE